MAQTTRPKKGRKPSREELAAARTAVWPLDGHCPLCGRPMIPGSSLNEHHLIPKSYGGSEKFVIHKVCHSKIHSLFSEAELAFVYNSFEKLKESPDIQKFIKWIRKQDPEVIVPHRRPREH